MAEGFSTELVKRFTGEIASRLGKASALRTTAQTLNSQGRTFRMAKSKSAAYCLELRRARPLVAIQSRHRPCASRHTSNGFGEEWTGLRAGTEHSCMYCRSR
jgi:hypothetical protein